MSAGNMTAVVWVMIWLLGCSPAAAAAADAATTTRDGAHHASKDAGLEGRGLPD